MNPCEDQFLLGGLLHFEVVRLHGMQYYCYGCIFCLVKIPGTIEQEQRLTGYKVSQPHALIIWFEVIILTPEMQEEK